MTASGWIHLPAKVHTHAMPCMPVGILGQTGSEGCLVHVSLSLCCSLRTKTCFSWEDSRWSSGHPFSMAVPSQGSPLLHGHAFSGSPLLHGTWCCWRGGTLCSVLWVKFAWFPLLLSFTLRPTTECSFEWLSAACHFMWVPWAMQCAAAALKMERGNDPATEK